eukprot:GHVS01029321.1.p1 GENE.GHVS01029321.1~~GHVS01029321.1.p1  ORF type:complete len:170 (+),score=22.37 GHVS01029321.1:66-575(+)
MLFPLRNIRSRLQFGVLRRRSPCPTVPFFLGPSRCFSETIISNGEAWRHRRFSSLSASVQMRMLSSTSSIDSSSISAANTSSLEDRMKWRPIELCGIRLELRDRPGELIKALQVVANHNMNLTRVEHRPQPLSDIHLVFRGQQWRGGGPSGDGRNSVCLRHEGSQGVNP